NICPAATISSPVRGSDFPARGMVLQPAARRIAMLDMDAARRPATTILFAFMWLGSVSFGKRTIIDAHGIEALFIRGSARFEIVPIPRFFRRPIDFGQRAESREHHVFDMA